MKKVKISTEQQNIIDLIGENNLVVDSVAGSGKTTTNQFIAMKYPDKKILLLTYNKRLKDETKQKFKDFGIQNATIHTFHSFCYAYYLEQAIRDNEIEHILNSKIDSRTPYRFDIIVVDEAQDLTPTYFRLVLKICKENLAGDQFTFCIMGDQNQCINQYLQADPRFILKADELFHGINKYPWKNASLSTTFRLTHEMCLFINQNVLSQQRLVSQKQGYAKPRYLICKDYEEESTKKRFQGVIEKVKDEILAQNNSQNTNYDAILTEIKNSQRQFKSVVLEVFYYLALGYKFEDIFILAPSIKTKTPASIIANDLSKHQIPILILNSEDNSNDLLFKNKIVFLSYNKAKGLERKVVIVLNFDEGYNKYFNKKNKNKDICANAHYVALTRGSEQLTVVHFLSSKQLRHLDFDEEKGENIEQIGEINNLEQQIEEEKQINVTSKLLMRHLPQNILFAAQKYLKHVIIRKKGQIIQAPTISQQQFQAFNFKPNEMLDIHEFVQDINETAVQVFLDICKNQNCFVFNKIEEMEKKDKYFHQTILEKNKIRYKNISRDNQQFISNPMLDDLLFVSNYWNGIKNRQSYKVNQIQSYQWMEHQTLISSLNRIYDVLDKMKKCNVSQLVQFDESDQLKIHNLKLESFISFVQERNAWELKFVEEIQDSHLIYLSIQKYIFLMEFKKNTINKLFNQLTACEQELSQNPPEFFIKNSKVFYVNKSNKVKECIFLHFSIDLKKAFILTKKNKRKAIFSEDLIHPDCFSLTQQISLLNSDQYYQFRLLNVYDGEIYEDQTSLQDLQKMVDILIDYKYGNKYQFENDQEFLESMNYYRRELNI